MAGIRGKEIKCCYFAFSITIAVYKYISFVIFLQDAFAHLAPCVPDHICKRPYGTVATDVRDFGAIGPCIGLGAVRCLDGLEGPPVPQPEVIY